MKGNIFGWVKRFFLSALLLFLGGLGGYMGLKNFSPSYVIIKYEHIYSDSEKGKIDKFVQNYLSTIDFSKFSPEGLCENLKNNFKFVKKVIWRWKDSERGEINIEGVQPIIRVSKTMVLGNKKRLFPTSLFSKGDLDCLRVVHISPSGEKVSSETYEFLKNVPEGYTNNYSVFYVGKNCVKLQRVIKDKRVKFLTKEEDLFNNSEVGVLGKLDEIKKDLKMDRKKKKYLACDLRFKNRICARLRGVGWEDE